MLAGLKMARRAEAQRVKVGARGGIRTCTGDALNVVSLLLDYASRNWILQPVLLRQDRFTKTICRLLPGGGKWSQSPVPPRTWRAYETHVSAGSTAMILAPINPAVPCLVIDWT